MSDESRPRIAFVLGSGSDGWVLLEADAHQMLAELGIPYRIDIISAHRNADEIGSYCKNMVSNGIEVFIAIAGMAAALPGAITSSIGHYKIVFGVPVDSGDVSAKDAVLSMLNLPPGCTVAICGTNVSGLTKTILAVAQVLAIKDDNIARQLCEWLKFHPKMALYNIQVSQLKSKNPS